ARAQEGEHPAGLVEGEVMDEPLRVRDVDAPRQVLLAEEARVELQVAQREDGLERGLSEEGARAGPHVDRHRVEAERREAERLDALARAEIDRRAAAEVERVRERGAIERVHPLSRDLGPV